jgi:hypothetical protein
VEVGGCLKCFAKHITRYDAKKKTYYCTITHIKLHYMLTSLPLFYPGKLFGMALQLTPIITQQYQRPYAWL